jgi:hypothetical protein
VRILNVPERFSQKWIERNVPGMESTEFHATFHEAATRGWSENELRQLAQMWGRSALRSDGLMEPTTPPDRSEPAIPEAPAEGGAGGASSIPEEPSEPPPEEDER